MFVRKNIMRFLKFDFVTIENKCFQILIKNTIVVFLFFSISTFAQKEEEKKFDDFKSFYAKTNLSDDDKNTEIIKEVNLIVKTTKDNTKLSYAYLKKGIIEGRKNDLDLAISDLLLAEKKSLLTQNFQLQSNVLYYLSYLYLKIGDFDNELLYAQKNIKIVNTNKLSNTFLAMSHLSLAEAYVSCFSDGLYDDVKTKEQSNFDLAILNFKKCIEYSKEIEANKKNYISEAFFGMASINFWQEKTKNRLTVLNYLKLSEQNLIKKQPISLFCKIKILETEYLLQDRNFQKAKITLEEIDKSYDFFNDDLSLLNVFNFYNVKLYNKLGDYKKTADWSNDLLVTNQMVYNLNRNFAVKKAEAKYINKTKILELEQTKKDRNNQRNLKYLGFVLLLITMLGMFSMYKNYKSKQREQALKQELLEKQKVEAELFAKLKEEEVKKGVLENQMVQQQKEMYQKQLMSSVLQIESKNKILIGLKAELESTKEDNKKISRIIDNGIALDEDFENFKINFENVYPTFFEQLQQKAAGELTQLDLKHCAYINMGLSSKEIGNLLHVEATSVRMARYRLKQKLALEKEDDLSNFINNVA
jgi:hypothetical protein